MEAPRQRLGDSTRSLVLRIKDGDDAAREILCSRYLPVLERWARGRVPTRVRDLFSTDDLVQLTFMGALDRLADFEPRGEGAFLAYLRKTLRHKIIDAVRKKKPGVTGVTEAIPDPGPSPIEQVISREQLDRYEAALLCLSERHQAAVILRIEFGFKYPEIARDLDCPSSDAARMLVSRAIVRLTEVIHAE